MAAVQVSVDGLDKAIKLVQNMPRKVKSAYETKGHRLLLRIQSTSQKRTPVDTGFLRRSHFVKFNGFGRESFVSTNANYAIFVHEGTRRMRARRFMRNAVISEMPVIRQFIEQISLAALRR